MKLSKIQSFVCSRKKSVLFSAVVASVLLTLLAVNFTRIVKASFGSWGDTSLINACVNSRGIPALVSPGTNCNASETQTTWLKDIDAGTGLTISRSSSGATLALTNDTSSGWVAANETWTYASADSPTFTFTVSGDDTGKYSPGMRIKLTQSSTTKYFIVTAVSYSSPNTTVTVYGGTDYTLANSTITNTYYSMQKAPQGFPLDPAKWTEKVTDTTRHNNNSVSAMTWYNTDSSDKITIPIGSWNVQWSAAGDATCTSSAYCWYAMTLSTSTSSESDSDLSAMSGNNESTSPNIGVYTTLTRNKVLNLTSKTTYYLDEEIDGSSTVTGSIYNDLSPMILKATSAYL